MECKCCNNELANGMSICPLCGFPTLSSNFDTETDSLIAEHRLKMLNGIFIEMKVYHYEITDNGSIHEPLTECVTIANAIDLTDNAIHWFGMEFKKLESDREIEIELNIVRNGLKRMVEVSIIPDHVISHSKIGISMCDGFQIRLTVGDENDYVFSNPTSVL